MNEQNKLSIEEMKKIAHEICEEEKRQYNIEDNIFPITLIEYYNDYVFSQKSKLTEKITASLLPIRTSGFNDLKGNNIVIFLKLTNKIKKIEGKVFRLAEVCYHEMWHSVQKQFDKYSYEGFLRDIDDIFKRDSNNDYLTEHSKYSFEIGANLYGISKAKEYMKNKYPSLYEKEKDMIENKLKEYYFDYMTYDASDNIERTIQLLKNKLRSHNTKRIESMDKLSPVLEIFLNSDMNYKKISEIMGHEKFKGLDKRIVYAFLSSKTFLESLNTEELTNEELSLLSEALQYTNTVYQNQMQLLTQEKNIKLNEFLKLEKSIIKKLSIIDAYYTKKIKHKLNFKRSDKKSEQHRKSISTYLEETNRLIKKRTSRGYLAINIFYVIGTILSILTIIYLLINM